MPPSHRCWRVEFRGCSPVVCYLHCPVGLAFSEGCVALAHISSRYHQSLSNQFYLQKNCRSHRRGQIDNAFSTETRLELGGIVGLVR